MTVRFLLRGRVRTGDPRSPDAGSLLVEDGVVLARDLSNEDLAAATRSPGVSVVEWAENQWVQPGYVDGHLHLLATAAARLSVDVSGAAHIEELLAVVGDTVGAGEPPGGTWWRFWGYDEVYTAGEHLTAAALDRVTGDLPVVVHHRTGHVAIVNRAALRRFGGGPADGVLVERHDLLSHVPRWDEAALLAGLGSLLDELAGRGIVACVDATHTNDLAALEFLGRVATAERPSLEAMVGADRVGELGGLCCGDAVGAVRIGHAKVMPRLGDDARVTTMVATARRAGFPVAIHSMDIDTLDAALAALDGAAGPGASGFADRVEHCSLALPEQLDHLAAIGAAVVTQPSFVVERGAKYRSALTEVEQQWLWPLKSLIDRGIAVGFGSDAPVVASDPARWIEGAVARSVGAHERIPAEVARRCATAGTTVVPGAGVDALVLATETPSGVRHRRLDVALGDLSSW
jgi:predicted amidohydrolase YtcJ